MPITAILTVDFKPNQRIRWDEPLSTEFEVPDNMAPQDGDPETYLCAQTILLEQTLALIQAGCALQPKAGKSGSVVPKVCWYGGLPLLGVFANQDDTWELCFDTANPPPGDIVAKLAPWIPKTAHATGLLPALPSLGTDAWILAIESAHKAIAMMPDVKNVLSRVACAVITQSYGVQPRRSRFGQRLRSLLWYDQLLTWQRTIVEL